MLKIKGLHAYYGSIEALSGIDMEAADGITCLIGSNGAGKSTLLSAISGMGNAKGSIELDGVELMGLKPQKIAKLGIAHVPEGRHVFPALSVEENLETGTITWHGYFSRKSIKEDLENVYELFPRLAERRKQGAWSLSGGEQQMLAMGRALMARPKFLLLDEPSMGLAPLVIKEMFDKIIGINKQGTPVLLVEQNAKMALTVSQYAYVLERGKIIISGRSEDLRSDDRIVKAYLGVSEN